MEPVVGRRTPSWVEAVAAIVVKDFKQYYSKAPVLSWGILFPATLVILFGYYGVGMGLWHVIPGLIAVSLLFAATSMAQVSVSFDKMSGGIELLVHSPIPGSAIIAGKAVGGIAMGLAGAGMAITLLYAILHALPVTNTLFLIAGLLLGSATFTFIAVLVAVALEPIHAVAALNLLRFTMIFLGGLIPSAVLPYPLRLASYALPMAYIADLVRYGTFSTYEFADPLTSLIASVIYAVFAAVVASKVTLDVLTP